MTGGRRFAVGAVTVIGLAMRVGRVARNVLVAQGRRRGDFADDDMTLPRSSDVTAVWTEATGLLLDAAGIVTAVLTGAGHLPRSPQLVTAAVLVSREHPRVHGALRARWGRTGSELALAVANAVAYGFGQSPTALVLDAALRASRLAEAVARVAASGAVRDRLGAPDRVSIGCSLERPVRDTPAETYAGKAVAVSAFAAGGAALLTGNAAEPAEAILAGSPKAARYGPAAFAAGLGIGLAAAGVLVRDRERLRLLEIVDTVVLHPSALTGERRAVLEAYPSVPDWDHDRLWQAAAAVLDETGTSGPELILSPVPDHESARTGLMVASVDGVAVGTVVLGWEVDPLAEAVLDAARRAGLHVVAVDDPELGDFVTLVDEVVDADRPLAGVVHRLRDAGRVVMTVARVPVRHPEGGGAPVVDSEVVAGLLDSDVAVAVTGRDGAVVWNADLVVPGLRAVWRVLTAVPAARTVSRQSRALAQAGALFSGLLLITQRGPRRGPSSLRGMRLSPVSTATAGALLVGWRAALRLATAGVPAARPRVRWHALAGADALSRLAGSGPRAPTMLSRVAGLVSGACRVVARSRLTAPARWSLRLAGAVRAELGDPLTPVLAVGAGASAIVGSTVDAALVIAAMAVNAMVGGVQRLRAERALSALAEGQQQRARRVSATGVRQMIDAARLRVGDVIEVEVGDVAPADARLLCVSNLEVDESSLTGESLPVPKQVEATPGAPIGERRCMLFEGTAVVAGRATAVVVGTGEQTEARRAVSLASRTPPCQGVQVRLRQLTRKALPLTLAGGVAVAALSMLRKRPVREAVSGGVAVAVAAVPEGLPLVATVAQMAAGRRLSRRGVLVRNPRALEALGRVNTVCFDKTGTLTENRLQVVRVTGPDGAPIRLTGPAAEIVLRAAARACPKDADGGTGHAHATDEGVLAAGPSDPDWNQLEGHPFEASRGYAAAVGFAGEKIQLVVKGAPEVVLPRCLDSSPALARAADKLAGEGLRVLAVAQRPLADHEAGHGVDEPPRDLEFLGFLALADIPRPGSPQLIAGLRAVGTRPVMLTGDHPCTAHAIATDLGWPSGTVVVTGGQLAAADRAGRAQLLRDADIIARVAPEQKLQVVQALQGTNRVVAMVGDGVNDAAAIRAADVGVGIAARGSAAARNAADLVLANGELTVLVDAVTEGRALWHSVADAISILIGGNAGEVGFALFGTLASGRLPLSTRQLLLVNLLTDMFPAMAVAVTPSDTAPGETAPGRPDTAPVRTARLGAPLTRQIRRRGIVTGLGATTAWTIGTLTPGTFRRTSTMALCGVVGAQLTQTLAGRRRSPLVLATAVGSAAALAGIIQTPLISHFFGCTPLGPLAWSGVGAAIAVAAVGPRLVPRVERLFTELAPTVQTALRAQVRDATRAADATGLTSVDKSDSWVTTR